MAGGLLGGLFGSAPDRVIVPRDEQADALLNAGIERSKRPDEAYGQETNAGVNDMANSLTSSPDVQQQAAQSGQNPAMLSAMSNVYRGQAQGDINKIMKTNDQNAQFRKSEALRQMSMAALGRQQAETNVFSQLTEAYNQQEAARAGVISSIFQVGRQGMMMSASKGKSSKTKTGDFGGGGGAEPAADAGGGSEFGDW